MAEAGLALTVASRVPGPQAPNVFGFEGNEQRPLIIDDRH